MDEHVLIAGHRLDEPITLRRVEPLDGAFLHRLSPALDVKKTRPRFTRATPQAGFLDLCSISWSRNAQSNGLKSDCTKIATRKLQLSKSRLRPGRRAEDHQKEREAELWQLDNNAGQSWPKPARRCNKTV